MMRYLYFFMSLLLGIPAGVWGQDKMDSILAEAADLQDPDQELMFLDSMGDILEGEFMTGLSSLYFRKYDLLAAGHGEGITDEDILEDVLYLQQSGELEECIDLINLVFTRLSERDPWLDTHLLYHRSYCRELLRRNEGALSDIDSAIILFESGAAPLSNIEYRDAYRSKGRILHAIGEYGASSIAFNTSKELNQKYQDSTGVAFTLWDMGILFSQVGLYDQAEAYFQERYNYISLSDASRSQDLFTTGRNLIIQGKYEDAKPLYKEALALMPDDGTNDIARIYIYNGLIEALYFSDEHWDIPRYFGEMENVFHDLSGNDQIEFLFTQSRCLYLLSTASYEEAESIAQELYDHSLTTGDATEVALHALFLTEVFKKKGLYENALRFTQLRNHLTDSIKTVNKANALALYQTQYETKEKEAEIVQLAAERNVAKTRSQLFRITTILLAIILGLGAFLFFQIRKSRREAVIRGNQLEDLNKTKDRFFSIIAHDIRSPIAALQSVDKQMDYYTKKKDMDRLGRISGLVGTTARNLNMLLDNLLNWALSQTGGFPYKPQNLRLFEQVDHAIDVHQSSADMKNIDLTNDVPTHVRVFADKSALNTVLRNLIANAIKFSHRDSSVIISAHEGEDHVQISIKDTGMGMSKDQLVSIFSLDKKSTPGTSGEKGTGLGLILCKELVELNKGQLKIESVEGEGTVCHFSVPGES